MYLDRRSCANAFKKKNISLGLKKITFVYHCLLSTGIQNNNVHAIQK